jgi:peptidoglycan/LPS O-acetylase OafA/YrhL
MKRFAALDSWRGIAACLVAFYHLHAFSAKSHLAGVAGLLNSYLFVDFFFVLSGFVIAANYEQRLAEGFSLWRFALLRFGRLYPLHLAVLAGCILLHLAHAAGGVGGVSAFQAPFWSADTVVANLLLLHSLHLYDFLTWNAPSWSISTEFYTYLLFAAAVALTTRRIAMLLVPAVLVSALALCILVPHIDTTVEWGLIRCIFGFSVGVLAWHVHRTTPLRSGTGLELMSIILMIVFVWRAGAIKLSIAAPAVFAVVVLAFAAEAGAMSRLLRAPALRWLGERSYSIYMVHFLVWLVLVDCAKLFRLAGIDLMQANGDLVSLVYFLLVLGVATVTYRWIEVPARACFRRLALPQSRQDARIAMQSAHETV